MALINTAADASRYCNSKYSSNYGESDAVEDVNSRLHARSEDPRLCYDMTGDKILIIFNHYRYKKTRYYRRVPSTREGTYQDVKSLEKTFRNRGFFVVTHNDWKYKDIIKYLYDVCRKEHSETSCLAVAVMSHGKGSHVCAADRMYPVADLTDILQAAPGLQDKPKLLLIQACREGHTRPRDQRDQLFTIPVGADCLVLYSTYEDYLSYRNSNGSWLMQALCEVIDTHHSSMDLLRMVALVNSKVAAIWGKQMPVTESNLTKFLML